MFSLATEGFPALTGAEAGVLGGGLAALLMFGFAIVIFLVILFLAIYVYMALAMMAIAKKTNNEPAWLAWIPVANLYLMSKIAKMHWWPMLLLIAFPIPFLNVFAMLAFAVFMFIWMWKIFEAVGRPGWWALLGLIPFAGGIIVLVLLGVAAWGKPAGAPAK
jgi:hypothetical protein